MKVELVRFGRERGYEIRITHPAATLGDYVRALEALTDEPALTRRRNPGGACYACPRCCAERIPITSIDALRLAEIPQAEAPQPGEERRSPARRRGREGGGRARKPERAAPDRGSRALDAVRRYGWVSVWGRVVDITLRRREAGECVLLDTGTGLCGEYERRPLVCRTFLCSPLGPVARRLREAAVNRGQDELVRLLLESAGALGFPINEANKADLRLEDWQGPNPYRGKTDYDQVPLRDLLPGSFWRRICPPGKCVDEC
ncbi:MAG: YkgJ family cysteine cluster protein [Moorellales bacterium]